MKYVLIDWVKDSDMFTEEFETAEEAVESASYEWEHLSEMNGNTFQKATRIGEVTSMCLSRPIRMRMRKTTLTETLLKGGD